MTDREKILLLRSSLKLAVHRLEEHLHTIKTGRHNCNPTVRVIAQCYGTLRTTQEYHDSIQPSDR
jgi:hypothetical protein